MGIKLRPAVCSFAGPIASGFAVFSSRGPFAHIDFTILSNPCSRSQASPLLEFTV